MNIPNTPNEDVDPEDADLADREFQRYRTTGELTKLSVALFEHYTATMGKNAALGLMIESLSETLGNMISLVADEHQQEVIDSANEVIQQGLTSQQEEISLLMYGVVGHA
jgi:hypothetical protein